MVAAGGAGSGWWNNVGHVSPGIAGGLIGYDGSQQCRNSSAVIGTSLGATQTRSGKNILGNLSGSFGIGGNSYGGGGGAGGGGYFGGSGGYDQGSCPASGSGGSSYISGHIGCVAIEESSTEDNITFPTKNNVLCADGTIDIECSKHYLGYVFTNTVMIDGKGYEWKYTSGDTSVIAGTIVVGMPTHDGTGTMTGNSGNGYAKITFVG